MVSKICLGSGRLGNHFYINPRKGDSHLLHSSFDLALTRTLYPSPLHNLFLPLNLPLPVTLLPIGSAIFQSTFSCINTPAFLSSSHRYVSNRQIHEDLGVPLFADHIRALTESFDSKLADVGNPLVRQLGRYLC